MNAAYGKSPINLVSTSELMNEQHLLLRSRWSHRPVACIACDWEIACCPEEDDVHHLEAYRDYEATRGLVTYFNPGIELNLFCKADKPRKVLDFLQ